MRPYTCATCRQTVFFDNSTCLRCGSMLGYDVGARRIVTLVANADGLLERVDAEPGVFRWCANRLVARCNWLLPAEDANLRCDSCRLTSKRPNDSEVDALAAFADAETAKRRLLHQLGDLALPVIDRSIDSERGVAFELLSSRGETVMTGHQAGVITLDLSESDDAHREFVRQQLGEPYRTVLGHLRHEIGHYYWPLLVVDNGRTDAFRALFGDERVSYEDALRDHYADESGDSDFTRHHVSQYATMHPWEDWAETFAHYLHIDDGLRTAGAFGLAVGDPSLSAGRDAFSTTRDLDVSSMVRSWLALTLALNGMSRSIGQGDLYPFVLSPVVVEKLDFVHRMVTGTT